MRIITARHAGFCNGVEKAVDKALELARKYGRIYTIGELVHNELVTDFLKSNGVDSIEIDELSRLEKGDVALIRAHGIPQDTERELIERGVIVEDATCEVVKRNQRIARERAEAGDAVVIIGDEKHDEVIGVKSYAGDDCTVIPDSEMPQIGDKPTSVIFQTTP